MQRILVLGSSGQLGSALAELLMNNENYDFIGLGSKDIDITNKENILEMFNKHRPNIVINTVAYTDVEHSEIEPRLAYELNTFAVFNLAQICHEMNIILVHISSDYVFGSYQMRVLTEDDDPNPLNSYGLSKLAGESVVKNIMRNNVPWYVVRTSNLYGKNPNKKKGTFLLNCLKKIKNKEIVYLNDINVMSPTYVNDLSYYILTMLNHSHGLYHATNSGAVNPYAFIKTAVSLIKDNNLSENYDTNNIVLNNEMHSNVNRPRFSFMGTNKNIGYCMPSWKKSLERFLIENRDIL